MEAFLIENAISIGGLLVTLISIVMAVRFSLKQVVVDVAELKAQSNNNAAKLAEHDLKIAVLQTEVKGLTGWMREMRDKINGIHRHILKGNGE